MKTTLKIGLFTAAFLLALASCSNVVNPTAVKDSVDTKAVVIENQYSGSTNAFKVKSIKAYKQGGDSAYKTVQVAVEFTHKIKKENLNDGVTFATLENASATYTMPKQNKVSPVGEVRIADTTAYYTLSVDWTAVTDLYVHVDATKVQAANGAWLNQDEDIKWAEKNDDDYATVFFLKNTTTGVTGNLAHRKNLDTNVTAAGMTTGDFSARLDKKNETISLTVGFASGLLDKQDKIVAATVSATALMALCEESEKATVRTTVAGLLNKHVTIEAYDWKEHKWTVITSTPAFAYNDTTVQWTAAISVPKNNPVRARIEKVNEVELSSLLHYGYPLKLDLDNNKHTIATTAVLPAREVTGAGDMWPTKAPWDDDLKFDPSTPGKVEITLKPNTSFFKAYLDGSWETISFDNKDKNSTTAGALKKSLFKGFKPETVINQKDNFKCFDIQGHKLAIRSVELVKGDVTNYPDALNKIVIRLEADNSSAFVQAAKVYISPKVETLEFKGSYLKGGNLVEATIKALCFANVNDSADPEAWDGWRPIKKV